MWRMNFSEAEAGSRTIAGAPLAVTDTRPPALRVAGAEHGSAKMRSRTLSPLLSTALPPAAPSICTMTLQKPIWLEPGALGPLGLMETVVPGPPPATYESV